MHSCGPFALFFQWYNLTFLGLLLLLVRTFWDIVKYDYIGFHFLSQEMVQQRVQNVCDGEGLEKEKCYELREELDIPPWLHRLSLVAPVLGFIGFLILSHRLAYFIKLNKNVKNGTKVFQQTPEDLPGDTVQTDNLPWKLADRIDWVVIILGTPLIFIVMAMRSLIRIWAVMTGSAYHANIPWDHMVDLELATYQMDLELAVAFQFFSCLIFGLLCTSFLQHSRILNVHASYSQSKYMRILGYTAVQGVYAFVFIGVLRTIFDIAVTYLSELPEHRAQAHMLQEQVLSKVGTIFSFVTVLCILNMLLISKVPDIAEGLNGANPKFTGVRLLLLIAQIQPQVLNGITVGSKLYMTLEQHAKEMELQDELKRWTFTKNQALLAHAALLNAECLLVAFLTWSLWRLKEKQEKALMKDLHASASASARELTGYQRLLDA